MEIWSVMLFLSRKKFGPDVAFQLLFHTQFQPLPSLYQKSRSSKVFFVQTHIISNFTKSVSLLVYNLRFKTCNFFFLFLYRLCLLENEWITKLNLTSMTLFYEWNAWKSIYRWSKGRLCWLPLVQHSTSSDRCPSFSCKPGQKFTQNTVSRLQDLFCFHSNKSYTGNSMNVHVSMTKYHVEYDITIQRPALQHGVCKRVLVRAYGLPYKMATFIATRGLFDTVNTV